MANLRIKGDTSGYVDLVAPDIAGSTTIELDKIVQADSSGNITITNAVISDSLQVGNTVGNNFTVSPTQTNTANRHNNTNYIASFQRDDNAFILVSSGNNSSNTGVAFYGAGDRGSVYGTSGYDIHIEPNCQYGQADIILKGKNDSTNKARVGINTTAPSTYLDIADYKDSAGNNPTGTTLQLSSTSSTTGSNSANGPGSFKWKGWGHNYQTGPEEIGIEMRPNWFYWGNNNDMSAYGQTYPWLTWNIKNSDSSTYDEKMRLSGRGDLEVQGYLTGGAGSVVQEVVMETNVLSTFSSVNAWGEPNSNYRLNITPKFSDSLIVLHYFVPLNQTTTGANNIFVFRSVRYSPNSSHLITSAGQQSGSSRMRVAGGGARSQNGYDHNDQNLESWIAYDRPGSTSQCTYGFEMKQESSDSGTIYIGYSSSDNGTWGYASRVIITAREIRQ